jgi:hypothetical protein
MSGEWVGLGSSRHRITHGERVWWLERAPLGSRHPWVLYNEVQRAGRPARNQEQEIGAPDLESAKHTAELWLDTAHLCT